MNQNERILIKFNEELKALCKGNKTKVTDFFRDYKTTEQKTNY